MMSLEGGMTPGGDDRMNRRGFLSITGIASVATILGVAPVGRLVYAAALTRAQRDKLTGLLAKVRPAVEATRYQGERSGKNYDFVDAVARKNVELTMADIRRRSAILADLETSGAVRTVGAMYNLETGLVEFFS